VLLAEVTHAREAATATEATHVMTMLTAETSGREAATVCDSATLHVKDAKDWAALVEREALEMVSRAEADNTVALASAREEAEGIVQKIALLEDELAAERQAWEVSEREHQA
jgi:BMFP domain-containing protein YqiC